MTSTEKRNLRNGLLFISPWLVGLAVFVLGPILFSLYASFCEYSVLRPPRWAGLSNYTALMIDDVFWRALANTLVFAGFSLPLGLVVSLFLAILLNTRVKGLSVFRTIFFLPSLVPMVALAIIWLWIFNGEHGVLNHFISSVFGLLGLEVTAPGWLTDPAWSKPALIMMSAWTVGHAIVIYLANLQDVPRELYEAADLDGASYLHKLWHVTIPMISPVILFNLIMGIIQSLQTFAIPYVISPEGSPARSIYFLAMYMYDNAFSYLRMGYACAIAWILFVIVLALTLLALRFSLGRVHYGGA